MIYPILAVCVNPGCGHYVGRENRDTFQGACSNRCWQEYVLFVDGEVEELLPSA